jgi:DHA1 family bicyclomycin/chloramphenicol resistance-like MFS transporter
MPPASSNVDSRLADKPPRNPKLLLLLGSIAILAPFPLDLYLPALPSIASNLRASAGSVQLTLPVFFVGLAVSQLFFGSIADHLGRRRPLLCGLALLVMGSVGCALAQGITALTAWRLVQALGVGSASVIPRAIVRDRLMKLTPQQFAWMFGVNAIGHGRGRGARSCAVSVNALK